VAAARSRSRSANGLRTGGGGGAAFKDVGARIRGNQLNQKLLQPSGSAIDERAQEEHLAREEARQIKLQEKREEREAREAHALQLAIQAEEERQERLQRQQALQAQFEQYEQLLRQNPAAHQQPQSQMASSSVEGFDRRRRPPQRAQAWNMEEEVVWQADRAKDARLHAEHDEKQRFILPSYAPPYTSEVGGGVPRHASPSRSPSRTQHRFIREEDREAERQRLYARRYGEA
jgi:hypothetical protein